MITNLALRTFIVLRRVVADANDDDGQTLAEYGLIISLVGVAAMITGVIVFRGALVDAFNSASDCLNGTC